MRVPFLVIVLVVLFLIGIASGVSPDKVKEVREKHEAKLFEEEGVSAVSDDEVTGEIIVYVEKEEHVKKIPKKLEDVPVRVEVIGRIEALKPAKTAPAPSVTCSSISPYSRTGCNRPVFGGISVGNEKLTGSAGTLGIIAKKDGTPVILSNAHVLAMDTSARFVPIGTKIWQPGDYDGGSDPVGALQAYIPITFKSLFAKNYADAAIASLSVEGRQGQVLDGSNTGFLTFNGVAGISGSGWNVYKSGRTTGVTMGTTKNTGATVKVYYTQSLYAYFRDQIITTDMSDPGDSGSFVWIDFGQSHYWVGLLFAGSDQATIICKMNRIQEGLGILL
jgi:hypothetical protein